MLYEIQYVRAEIDDVEALRRYIRAALETERNLYADRSSAAPRVELASWLASTLVEIRSEPTEIASRFLQDTVATLFRRAGGEVELSPWPNAGPDLAVLLDAPSLATGALLVEVKQVRTKADLRRAMLQVQDYVLQRGASLGIVVYLSMDRPIERPASVPRIIAVDLAELPSRLEAQSLGDILALARNRAVHEQ